MRMEVLGELPWIGYQSRTEAQLGAESHSLGEWRYLVNYQVVDIGQLDAAWGRGTWLVTRSSLEALDWV